jgi:hypothetical protein
MNLKLEAIVVPVSDVDRIDVVERLADLKMR